MDTFLPIEQRLNILLVDDDEADCLLFQEALEELPVSFELTIVHNNEKLMDELTRKNGHHFPDVLFLDLNMPRKNGMVTLSEIKRSNDLDHLPVIIFSNMNDPQKINQVFNDAAHYYIRKPAEFSQLKKVIYEALTLITQKYNPLPQKENFELTGD